MMSHLSVAIGYPNLKHSSSTTKKRQELCNLTFSLLSTTCFAAALQRIVDEIISSKAIKIELAQGENAQCS